MLTRHQALTSYHFGYAPDDVTCAHVGTFEYCADILKRITDSALTAPFVRRRTDAPVRSASLGHHDRSKA